MSRVERYIRRSKGKLRGATRKEPISNAFCSFSLHNSSRPPQYPVILSYLTAFKNSRPIFCMSLILKYNITETSSGTAVAI